MYKTLIIAIFSIGIIHLGLCQTTNKSELNVNFIEFGSGGGFSGKTTDYLITQTGKLYLFKNILSEPNALEYQKEICSCKTKKLFNYVTKNKIMNLSYNETGNRYQYIHLQIENKNNHLLWSTTENAPASIQTLYSKLNKLL